MSLGTYGDSFYEYLLKVWIQSGQTDSEARQMYDDAIAAVNSKLIQTSPGGLIYLANMKNGRIEHKMEHLACFAGQLFILIERNAKEINLEIIFLIIGGLFALGAATKLDENSEKYMKIGKGITNTCHESYVRTAVRLGPDGFG